MSKDQQFRLLKWSEKIRISIGNNQKLYFTAKLRDCGREFQLGNIIRERIPNTQHSNLSPYVSGGEHPCLPWTRPFAAEIDAEQCVSHDDHKPLTEQSLSVRILVWMTWVNQQNDINGHNDATCTCLVLLSVQKTTGVILLSYTLYMSCRSSYEWDFITKYRVLQLC